MSDILIGAIIIGVSIQLGVMQIVAMLKAASLDRIDDDRHRNGWLEAIVERLDRLVSKG